MGDLVYFQCFYSGGPVIFICQDIFKILHFFTYCFPIVGYSEDKQLDSPDVNTENVLFCFLF